MSATEFDSGRSAAIRQLLLDTVADAPRRDRRTRFAIVGALTGAALAVAGGTAALALTGVLHFGSPDPAPVPVPTPSRSATPTPGATPTPTPTPTPSRTIVQSGPITPHDVDALPATPTWSLTLPGPDDDCRSTITYDLSDGLALFETGVRPKEYEGGPCGDKPDLDSEDHGLALVDTEQGKVLWTREWTFTRQRDDQRSTLLVLGTSGRALFDSGRDGEPGEVIDLADGQTVAPFDRDLSDLLLREVVTVSGPSGDILLIHQPTDDDGRYVGHAMVSRVDPRDTGHPRWSTELPGTYTGGAPFQLTTQSLALSYDQDQWHPVAVALDAETGELRPRTVSAPPSVIGDMNATVDQASDTVVVTDASGVELWRHSGWHAQYVGDIPTTDSLAALGGGGRRASSGMLDVTTADKVMIVRADTGAVVVDDVAAACGRSTPALYDPLRDVFLSRAVDAVCTMDRSSGAVVSPTSIPTNALWLPGRTNLYDTFWPATTGTAYAMATGEKLWSRPLQENEFWTFAGGYLVSLNGIHMESLG